MSTTIRVRDVVRLSVRFGSQVRTKCHFCTKFLTPRAIIKCVCGARYARLHDDQYEVLDDSDE
jgi:hypothetical protein